jgi:hypothetical protein
VIGVANYGLTFTVDAPYLLEEGVDVNDFPTLVKIPIANTTNLYGTGETADTIYFESEGEVLKHELVEITATYLYAWIKLDLETSSKKVVTLHYGALEDNNYEDKRAVWVNGVNIYHFNGDGTDTMGINPLTPTANVVFNAIYGVHYKGVYVPAGHALAGVEGTLTVPMTVMVFGFIYSAPGGTSHNRYLAGASTNYTLNQYASDNVGTYNTVKILTGITTTPTKINLTISRAIAGNNLLAYLNGVYVKEYTYTGALSDSGFGHIGKYGASTYSTTAFSMAEVFIFNDAKSAYWICALQRLYNNPDAYIEYGTEVDLDALTATTIEPVDCVANISKQLGIYDVDFRNIMYEVGDFNATWRLPGTEGITIWGIYQPRPVGDYYFPEMDNLGINDALFFTVTDYLVDIHDKIDIEGVRFDLQAIQVHPIADQKIYKMCVLKRQPEYYATCKGIIS